MLLLLSLISCSSRERSESPHASWLLSSSSSRWDVFLRAYLSHSLLYSLVYPLSLRCFSFLPSCLHCFSTFSISLSGLWSCVVSGELSDSSHRSRRGELLFISPHSTMSLTHTLSPSALKTLYLKTWLHRIIPYSSTIDFLAKESWQCSPFYVFEELICEMLFSVAGWCRAGREGTSLQLDDTD